MRSLRLVHSHTSREPSPSASTGPREIPSLDAELRALLEHARIIVPVPPIVRARAMARARAALAAPGSPPTHARGIC